MESGSAHLGLQCTTPQARVHMERHDWGTCWCTVVRARAFARASSSCCLAASLHTRFFGARAPCKRQTASRWSGLGVRLCFRCRLAPRLMSSRSSCCRPVKLSRRADSASSQPTQRWGACRWLGPARTAVAKCLGAHGRVDVAGRRRADDAKAGRCSACGVKAGAGHTKCCCSRAHRWRPVSGVWFARSPGVIQEMVQTWAPRAPI